MVQAGQRVQASQGLPQFSIQIPSRLSRSAPLQRDVHVGSVDQGRPERVRVLGKLGRTSLQSNQHQNRFWACHQWLSSETGSIAGEDLASHLHLFRQTSEVRGAKGAIR